MFLRVSKNQKTSEYLIEKFDSEFRLIDIVSSSKNEYLIKKFIELKEPLHNIFWFNSKKKLNWEII